MVATIRNLLSQKERTQTSLALELTIVRQSTSAYYRGVTLTDIYSLIRIADYFDVTLDELTGRKRNVPHKINH